jgi:hypothetical protein
VREGSIIEGSNEGEIMALFPLVVAAALAPRKGSLGPSIHFGRLVAVKSGTSCRLVNATNRVANRQLAQSAPSQRRQADQWVRYFGLSPAQWRPDLYHREAG